MALDSTASGVFPIALTPFRFDGRLNHASIETIIAGYLKVGADAHLPLLHYEQQQGVGLAVRKYVMMKRGFIASDAQARGFPRL